MSADHILELCHLLGHTDPGRLEFDWVPAEERLEVVFPDDFKDLASVFAESGIGDFFWLLHPNSSNPNLDISTQFEQRSSSLRHLAETESVPYLVDDLVPWAISDNGDVLYFVRGSELIAVNDARSGLWVEYVGSTSQFLYEILTGQFQSAIFPDDIVLPLH